MTPERRRQIDELFDGALQLDPAAREAWLREACGGDEDLRAEVGRHLAGDERAVRDGFVRPPEGPARGPERRTTERPDPESPRRGRSPPRRRRPRPVPGGPDRHRHSA